MELEKTPNIGSERRQNKVSSGANAASGKDSTSVVSDSSTDHALLLLLQALADMSQAQGDRKQKPAAEFDREDIIHAVDMFFDTILSSDRCSVAVKNLIGMLQIPVLKSAARNGKFFSDNRHPARRLIKALYLEASKLDASSNVDHDPLYISLLEIVKGVVRDFNGDERIFLRAYFDVCQL